MAKYCDICGKGKVHGNNISFSVHHTKRTWSPNVHKVKVMVDGKIVKKNVCTRCLRSGKVQRAL